SSDPARARALTCCAVPSTSAVSVFVMDCTTMGAPPPTRTEPMDTWTEARREIDKGIARSPKGGNSTGLSGRVRARRGVASAVQGALGRPSTGVVSSQRQLNQSVRSESDLAVGKLKAVVTTANVSATV